MLDDLPPAATRKRGRLNDQIKTIDAIPFLHSFSLSWLNRAKHFVID